MINKIFQKNSSIFLGFTEKNFNVLKINQEFETIAKNHENYEKTDKCYASHFDYATQNEIS